MAPDGPGLSFIFHPCKGLLDSRSLSPCAYGGEKKGWKLNGPQERGPTTG